MIKLYFDNKEVEKDYYRSLSQSFILFDKSFCLGSVPSNTFRIELNAKSNITSFNEVKIKLDDKDYAHVFYDNLETSNGNKNIIPLSDAMVDFEFNYDASPLIKNSPNGYVTILEILEDICSKKGVTLVTKNFNLKDKHITWYDSTISARKYISYIATLNGGFAKINRKGELELVRYSNDIKAEINTCKDYKIGEHHKITRVVWDIGVDKWEYGNETGDTLYLDVDNPFITEKEDIESIYNLIKDLEFYSMEISRCPIDSNIEIGDMIAFRKGDTLYPFIAQLEFNYNGGFNGGYKTILNTKKVEETSVDDTQKNIKSIKTRLNRDEAELEIIATETSDNTKEINSMKETILTKEGNNHICLEEAYGSNAIEYNIEGKCEQEGEPSPNYPSEIKTVKGIENLIEVYDKEPVTVDGVTCSVKNGVIYLKGTATAAGAFYIPIKEITLLSGTYTHTINNDGTNVRANCNFRYNYGSDYFNINPSNRSFLTQTLSSDIMINRYYIQYINGDTLDFKLKPMLEKSPIAHSYVPYGSWLKSKITGKNLLNNTLKSGTLDGINYVVNNDKAITINGTANGTYNTDIVVGKALLAPGEYFISGSSNSSLSGTHNLRFRPTAGYWNNYKHIDKNGSKIVVEEHIECDLVLSINKGVTVANEVYVPMIEHGSIATAYEPYKEQEVLIDMNKYNENKDIVGNYELCSINNYKDTLEVTSGHLSKKIGKVVLNGSENWTKATEGYYYNNSYLKPKSKSLILSDRYKNYTSFSEMKKYDYGEFFPL